MLSPHNPFAPQPTGFEDLVTFDPYGPGGISTNAAFYIPGCGDPDPTINTNCGCA